MSNSTIKLLFTMDWGLVDNLMFFIN